MLFGTQTIPVALWDGLTPRLARRVSGPLQEGVSPGPYAIAALDDIVWCSETGVTPNTLVRFDPKSEAFQTWPIPSGGGVVRNMIATTEGYLALACSGVDRIALVEVK